MMIDNNRILEILLEADADPNDPNKQPNEKPKMAAVAAVGYLTGFPSK